jgi:uncharacterized membrane protein YcaP (DUF421 family)
MDAVLRAAIVYLVLLLLFRISGKRSLSQVTTFDFVVLLIVGEASQQALLGENFSITHAALVVATLILLDRISDYLGWRLPAFGRVTQSIPVILVEDGRVLTQVLAKEHLDESDILTAARETQGLERLDQIKWAVLETSGGISIVPRGNT